MGKVEYVRCPRCELNYIEKGQNICKVCEAEIASKGNKEISDEEAKELNLCPICKKNYLMEDEEICEECATEQSVYDNQDDINMGEEQVEDKEDKTENWRQYVENDDTELPEDEFGDMTSITTEDELLDGEDMDFGEKDEEFEDEEEFEEEFEDDFDESLEDDFDESFDDEDDDEDDFDDEDEDEEDDFDEEDDKDGKK